MEEKGGRDYLSVLITLVGVTTFSVICGFLLLLKYSPPLERQKELPIYELGRLEEYKEGDVKLISKGRYKFYVIRENGMIYALLGICPHLGCCPLWQSGNFICPCHGSRFLKSGISIAGPANRAMERVKIFTDKQKNLMVDLSKKFKYELGEWNDPDSFIKIY